MARSIKSKRGKMLRRVLRDRYAKKADTHLKKIVEMQKTNDMKDIVTLVNNLNPRFNRLKKKNTEEMEAVNVESSDEEVEVKADVKEEDEEAKAAALKEENKLNKKMKFYNGNLESLRNKHGVLPRWVSHRKLRKQFVNKKIRKDRSKLRRSLRLN